MNETKTPLIKCRFPEFHYDITWENKLLKEIATVATKKSNREDSSLNGKFVFFTRSKDTRTSDKYLFDEEAIIIAGEGYEFYPVLPKIFYRKIRLTPKSVFNYEV